MRPGDVEPGQSHHLALRVDEELVLQAGIERAETADRRHPGRMGADPSVAECKPQIGRDPLGDIDIEIEFAGTVGGGRRAGKGRQRHLVGDKRVVGQDGGRKEAVAGEAVGAGQIRLAGEQHGANDEPRAREVAEHSSIKAMEGELDVQHLLNFPRNKSATVRLDEPRTPIQAASLPGPKSVSGRDRGCRPVDQAERGGALGSGWEKLSAPEGAGAIRSGTKATQCSTTAGPAGGSITMCGVR